MGKIFVAFCRNAAIIWVRLSQGGPVRVETDFNGFFGEGGENMDLILFLVQEAIKVVLREILVQLVKRIKPRNKKETPLMPRDVSDAKRNK